MSDTKTFQTSDYKCVVTKMFDETDEKFCINLKWEIPGLEGVDVNVKLKREQGTQESAQRLFDGQNPDTVQAIFEGEIQPFIKHLL